MSSNGLSELDVNLLLLQEFMHKHRLWHALHELQVQIAKIKQESNMGFGRRTSSKFEPDISFEVRTKHEQANSDSIKTGKSKTMVQSNVCTRGLQGIIAQAKVCL